MLGLRGSDLYFIDDLISHAEKTKRQRRMWLLPFNGIEVVKPSGCDHRDEENALRLSILE